MLNKIKNKFKISMINKAKELQWFILFETSKTDDIKC